MPAQPMAVWGWLAAAQSFPLDHRQEEMYNGCEHLSNGEVLLTRHVEVDQVGLEAARFPGAISDAGEHPD